LTGTTTDTHLAERILQARRPRGGHPLFAATTQCNPRTCRRRRTRLFYASSARPRPGDPRRSRAGQVIRPGGRPICRNKHLSSNDLGSSEGPHPIQDGDPRDTKFSTCPRPGVDGSSPSPRTPGPRRTAFPRRSARHDEDVEPLAGVGSTGLDLPGRRLYRCRLPAPAVRCKHAVSSADVDPAPTDVVAVAMRPVRAPQVRLSDHRPGVYLHEPASRGADGSLYPVDVQTGRRHR